MQIETTNILGVGISAITPEIACQFIAQKIQTREKCYITVANVHSVVESRTNPELLTAHCQAGLVTPDGMPLVWASHWFGHKQVKRVYGPGLMAEVCARLAGSQASHFFYGATESTLAKLQEKLTNDIPNLKVAGSYSPPFGDQTAAETSSDLDKINQVNPDVIWVGLGAPKQEIWMNKYRSKLNAPVIVGVGAAFDFLSGVKPTAPALMQRLGLEWLFRLISEPGRLWKRYFVTNTKFILLISAQLIGLIKFR